MTTDLRYVKNLTRFNYWEFPAFNPTLLHKTQTCATISAAAHADMTDTYRRAYEAGEEQAIYDYVKDNVWAFRASWVVTQIEAWRHDNTPDSRKKLHKLMRAYTDDRGRDALAGIVRLIKRDQEIFQSIMVLHDKGMSFEDCFAAVAHQPPDAISVNSAREIYRKYKAAINALMGNPPSRAVQQASTAAVTQRARSLGLAIPIDDTPPQRGVAGSWQEAFQLLVAMAQQLEETLGG